MTKPQNHSLSQTLEHRWALQGRTIECPLVCWHLGYLQISLDTCSNCIYKVDLILLNRFNGLHKATPPLIALFHPCSFGRHPSAVKQLRSHCDFRDRFDPSDSRPGCRSKITNIIQKHLRLTVESCDVHHAA